MNNNELINQALGNCPYLLRIQIDRDEISKENTRKWLERVIETAKKDVFNAGKC